MPEASLNITIRRCVPQDAEALSKLAQSSFYDTFHDTCSAADMEGFLARHYSEPQLLKELEEPDDYTFFAIVDGMPAGYLRLLPRRPPFAVAHEYHALELNRLYIDKHFLGQGVAQALMSFFREFAAAGQYRFLWLGVWEHNYRAQAFYRKYGFSDTGHTHPFPIGDTPQTDQYWSTLIEDLRM